MMDGLVGSMESSRLGEVGGSDGQLAGGFFCSHAIGSRFVY